LNNLQYIFHCLKTQRAIKSGLIEYNLDEHDKKFYLHEKSPDLAYADNPHDETSLALNTAFLYCLSHSFDTIDFVEIEILSKENLVSIIDKNRQASYVLEPWEKGEEKEVSEVKIHQHNIYFRPLHPTVETQALLQDNPFNKFKKNRIALSAADIATYFKDPYQSHLLNISQHPCLNEHFMARLSQVNPDKNKNHSIIINVNNFNQIMAQYFPEEIKFLSSLEKNEFLIDYSHELQTQISQANKNAINAYKKLI
jgi:hypothetical protein